MYDEKRSRLELYIHILREIRAGVDKLTNIMYKCNLSWKPLQEILDSMLKQELIRTTEKRIEKDMKLQKKV